MEGQRKKPIFGTEGLPTLTKGEDEEKKSLGGGGVGARFPSSRLKERNGNKAWPPAVLIKDGEVNFARRKTRGKKGSSPSTEKGGRRRGESSLTQR